MPLMISRRRVFMWGMVAALAEVMPAIEGRAADAPTDHAQVTILTTTDMHGHLDPIDYYTNKPDQTGLAKAAAIIRQARKEQPDLLLLDSGDTIQGTPLVTFHNRKNNAPPDPMMLAMSALGYDAMAVGNHEYNFGLRVLEKARSEATFPWLSANTYAQSSDRVAYQPYLIKEVNGVRVGILGFTTPGIPSWENPENYAGLEFRDPVTEAKKWVEVLRAKEHADLVVIAMHMGLEIDLRTGERTGAVVPNENTAVALAREVPGIDVILMGHTHREVSALFINGVLLVQAGRWADHVGRVDVYLDRAGNEGGHETRWHVTAKSSRTIPITERVVADPEIVKLAEPYDRETQAWLGKVIGESTKELSARDSRLRDTAILDLIQRVQLDASHADVSMAASFNLDARVPQGPVTVRDIAGLYIYENTLVVLEVTGAQLKEALELSARYFRPYEAGRSPRELIDDRIPGYNFDIAEGVSYEIDLTKPFGERVQDLRFGNEPLDPRRKLRLAVNNYRFNGGGGYTMYKGAPVLWRSSEEIRDLVIDWVERHRTLPTEPTNNWRLLPAE